jgi:hypothetical protein
MLPPGLSVGHPAPHAQVTPHRVFRTPSSRAMRLLPPPDMKILWSFRLGGLWELFDCHFKAKRFELAN